MGRHGAPCSAEGLDHAAGPRAGREQADPAGRRVGQPRSMLGRVVMKMNMNSSPGPGRTVFSGHEVRQSLLLSLGRAVITKPAGEEVRTLHPNSSTRQSPPQEQHSSERAPKIQSGNTIPARGNTESASGHHGGKTFLFPARHPRSELRDGGSLTPARSCHPVS